MGQSKDRHSRPCSGNSRTSSRCLILSTKMPRHTKAEVAILCTQQHTCTVSVPCTVLFLHFIHTLLQRIIQSLCHTILYCTVLYCTVLYCTALHCTALHCTVLYCTALLCTALYCTVLYCTVLYCTVLYCTV